METWSLSARDLKKYPHFDSWILAKDAVALATNPDRVATHAFYPFMRYVQGWTRFAEKGGRGSRKDRPIRYAARGDAYIFAYYRHLLSGPYEAALKAHGLQDNVLAYRRIPDTSGPGGKCNIHFARDAFLKIRELDNCCVVALDISSFFENLDHKKLYELWSRMIGKKKLPADHLRVFLAITKYAAVDKQKVYERLGHFGPKRKTRSGVAISGYLTPFAKMPKQLCTGKIFRQKIAGGNGQKSLIEKNFRPYGIPQGSPISDLLANLYLLDFDRIAAGWAKDIGGNYYRYSDDILFIVPGDRSIGLAIMNRAQVLIKTFGAKLEIKESKSSILEFKASGDHQTFELVKGTQGKNGLEYLGFRFDGRHAYIRDSTLSNLYRKVARSARRAAIALARRYSDRSASDLAAIFDYDRLIKRFGRVEDFGEIQDDYKNWTFWTYTRRAASVFGSLGKPILGQLKQYRQNIRRRAESEIAKASAARMKR
jgi:Reverse transcriptase (RNA-dependent DNA polymerase)